MQQFFGALSDEDYFGYISLDSAQQAARDEISIEKCGANKPLKKKVMKDIAERGNDYVFT